MNNNINLNIVANANTKAARKEIDALASHVRAINRDQRNTLNVIAGSGLNTAPIARVSNEIDSLTQRLHKGKLAAGDFGRIWKNQTQIIRRQSELASAQLVSFQDKIRGIRSGSLIMDDFSKSTVRTVDRLRLLGAGLEAASHRVVDIGKNIQWAGRQITVGFTVPFGIAAGLAAREFMQVEDQIVRFQKVFNENMGTPLVEATERVKELSRTIVTEMGRAQEETLEVAATFAQMGKSIDEVERLTTETMRLSTLGEVPIETSTDLLRSLQAVYRFNNEELTKSVDLLNSIENNTSLTVAAMAESMPQIVPIFDQFNLSLGEGTSLLAGMNEILGDANEAATAFKAIAQRMFDPTQEAIDKFADFGIDLEAIVSRNKDDLIGFLVELGDILEANNVTAQAFAETFGNLMGVRQAGRGLSLITQTRDAIRGLDNDTSRAMDRIGNDTENAADAQRELDAQMSSVSNTFRRMIQEMKVEIVDFGKIFLEMALPIVSVAKNIITALNDMDKGTKLWVARIAALVALIGPIKMFSGIALNLFGTLGAMIARLMPRMASGWSEQSRAANLASFAYENQDREARELVGTMYNLENVLHRVSNAQSAMSSSTMAAAASMSGSFGGMNPKGGKMIFLPGHGWVNEKGPTAKKVLGNQRKITGATSVQRKRTQVAGGAGGLAMLALLGTNVLNQTGAIESNTAQIANNILMWGSGIAVAAQGLKGFAGRSKIVHGAFQSIGHGVNLLGTKAMPGLMAKIGGRFSVAAIGGATVAGAVGAVAFGIKKWFDYTDGAARKMADFRDIAKEAEKVFGLEEFGSSAVFTDEDGEEVVKRTQEAIDLGMESVRASSNDRMRRFRGGTLAFDVILRGGDLDLVREMVDAINMRTGNREMNIDVNTTSFETAVDSLKDTVKNDLTDAVNRFVTGANDPSVLGRIFQGRDSSVAGQKDQDVIANTVASIINSNDADLIKEMLEPVRELFADMAADQHAAIAHKIADALGQSGLKSEVETLDELLGHLTIRFDGLADAIPDVDLASTRLREAAAEAESAWNESSQRFMDAWGTMGGMGEVIDSLREGMSALTEEQLNQLLDISYKLKDGLELSNSEMTLLNEIAEDLGLSQNELNTLLEQGVFASGSFIGALRNLINFLHVEGINATHQYIRERDALQAERNRNVESIQQGWVDDLNKKFADVDMEAAASNYMSGGAGKMSEDEEPEDVDLSGKRSAIDDVINDFVDKIMDGFDDIKDGIKERYDNEIKAIEETKRLAEERDDVMKKAFEEELERQRRLLEQLQTNIDYDAALARGDLDSAAEINQQQMFGSIEEGYEEFIKAIEDKADIRDEKAAQEIDAIENTRDAELDAHDDRVDAIKEELEVLNRTTPATIGEWQTRVAAINSIVAKHGLSMNAEVKKFGVDGFSTAIDNWQTQVAEDARWSAMEEKMKEHGKAQGDALGDGFSERVKSLMEETEQFVGMKLFGTAFKGALSLVESETDRSQPETSGGQFSSGFNDMRGAFYHTGGKIKGMGEVPIIAQSDEFMMQRSAVQRYGLDFMEAINAGRFHEGGLVPGNSKYGGIFGMFDSFIHGVQNGFSSLSQRLASQGQQLGGIAGQVASSGGAGAYGGYNVQYGGSGSLSIPEIYKLARSVGLNKQQAQLATAIALGESGGKPGAVGDVNLQNSTWGPSVGLWQVRSLRNQTGTGAARDVNRLKDPAFNARSMLEISRGGTYWNPWTVFTKGIYNKFLGEVQRQTMGLSKGGLLLGDSFANLHKGEAVLRAPIAKSLENGIRALETGAGGNHYEFNIGEFHGTEENMERFAKVVMDKIERKEALRGRRRVYG
ncbi:MAG: phage tail tape measure protein [Sphaerochaetaceae bacterium]